jgi:hypothetical protein
MQRSAVQRQRGAKQRSSINVAQFNKKLLNATQRNSTTKNRRNATKLNVTQRSSANELHNATTLNAT